MRRTAAILALVAVVSMFGASDVRGGAAGTPAGKTTGPNVVATIVIDVTGGISAAGKGLSSIRVQRSGSSAAALFDSSYVKSWQVECSGAVSETDLRFVGLVSAWVPSSVLTSLFGPLGSKAAIVDTDYATCTDVTHVPVVDPGPPPVFGPPFVRHVLSFTAVIQFQP
jgi:hypothetical protein